MTKAEKYPYSVEAIILSEAKRLVEAVWQMHFNRQCDDYAYRVQIKPEVWNALDINQQEYFALLFDGSWLIRPINGCPGVWLCVRREAIYEFRYHPPLRVHPVRVHK